LFLSLPPELIGALLSIVGVLTSLALRAIKRHHDLRISTELTCRADELERQAADLRAEAFRRRLGI
jgi:hypothetical protein